MTFGDITFIHFIYKDSFLNSMHLIPSNKTPVIIIIMILAKKKEVNS